MWIKSQNGQILVNAVSIYIEPLSNRHITTGAVKLRACNSDDVDFIIGEYDSMEEATAVIDYICDDIAHDVVITCAPQKGVVLL